MKERDIGKGTPYWRYIEECREALSDNYHEACEDCGYKCHIIRLEDEL